MLVTVVTWFVLITLDELKKTVLNFDIVL